MSFASYDVMTAVLSFYDDVHLRSYHSRLSHYVVLRRGFFLLVCCIYD